MTGAEFNWTPLDHAYSNGGAFSACINYLAERQRAPRNQKSKVGNLAANLAARGCQFQFQELEMALKVFQEAGCGYYHRSRPLQDSYLKWDHSALEIAQELLARVNSEKPLDLSKRDEAHPSSEVWQQDTSHLAPDFNMEIYSFPVRRGVMLEVKIRSDMTASETNNLADFVRIIAASRASSVDE